LIALCPRARDKNESEFHLAKGFIYGRLKKKKNSLTLAQRRVYHGGCQNHCSELNPEFSMGDWEFIAKEQGEG
jgi:hypothetical protein